MRVVGISVKYWDINESCRDISESIWDINESCWDISESIWILIRVVGISVRV